MTFAAGESAISFNDGDAYERFMGRWSRAAGRLFLDWLNPPPLARWLEVGCGSAPAAFARCGALHGAGQLSPVMFGILLGNGRHMHLSYALYVALALIRPRRRAAKTVPCRHCNPSSPGREPRRVLNIPAVAAGKGNANGDENGGSSANALRFAQLSAHRPPSPACLPLYGRAQSSAAP